MGQNITAKTRRTQRKYQAIWVAFAGKEGTMSESTKAIPSMTAEERAARAASRREHIKKGLVIVNTGDGKGKTTAALGILMRAWGRDMRLGGVQFFKHENASFGELKATERMGIQLTPMGDGFTWTSKDID